MEAARQTKIATSLPIMAVLATIAVAFYVSRRPLESVRPEAPAGLTEPKADIDKIDAMLWQDPLKVALEHQNTMHDEGKAKDGSLHRKCYSFHWVDQVSERINDILDQTDPNYPNAIVHVLLTIIRDGPFAEDHERRLRNRYAVLAALHSSGLAPEDSKHIQYFTLAWPGNNNPENTTHKAYNDKRTEPLVVPFESFVADKLYPAQHEINRPEHVLVLWLPESAFSHRPLTRLARVIDAIGHTSNDDVRINIIGPSHSGTLQKMLEEINDLLGPSDSTKLQTKLEETKRRIKDFVEAEELIELEDFRKRLEKLKKLNGVKIFSPWSTVSPALLVDNWPVHDPNRNSISKMYEVIPKEFHRIDVDFNRMIGSDDLLAIELINELRRRGVDVLPKNRGGKEHSVALISEWDRFYGKAFPRMFAAAMESMEKTERDHSKIKLNWTKYTKKLVGKNSNDEDRFPNNLLTCSYIRGIDGRLPEFEASKDKQSSKDIESESKWTYAKSPELPTGRSQLDYIRRLAQKLNDDYDVKAFGVVGTDVYDKLLLFQALREELNDVILFTIDLDARMMHYKQFKWTRNVIVASNFGLELNSGYQLSMYAYKERNLPIFRDGYQTALFFACWTALGIYENTGQLFGEVNEQGLSEVLAHPRLFEIGRDCAVDISVDVDEALIHPLKPKPPTRWILLKLAVPLSLAILYCTLLLTQLLPGVGKMIALVVPKAETLKKIVKPKTWSWKALKKILKPKTWDWASIGIRTAVVAIIVFVVVVIYDNYRPRGEPFSLVRGVSIWPGEALRLVAIILSVYFIVKSMKDLENSEIELCKWFNPNKAKEFRESAAISYKQWWDSKNLSKYSKSPLNPRTWWRYQRDWISLCSWENGKEKKSIKAEQLWREYLIRGTFAKRLFRFVRVSLAYCGLCFMLMLILSPPNTPYRGIVSFVVDRVLLALSVIFMIILMFFVVDATRLSVGFVRNLKDALTDWGGLAKTFGDNKDKKTAAEWLDIKFIASHSEAIGKMIYYPFIILAVMVLARNRYFDNWDFPISLIIILFVYFIHALSCAISLRRLAEQMRRKALNPLEKELVKITGLGKKDDARQLENMIEEIKSLRQGVFSPFTESPVVRVLIGSGGVGLLTLLRFFPTS